MRATAQQPQRAPDGAQVHYERHRPEQTTLYCLVQQHAVSFIAHTAASIGAELPRFIKDEFDAFLECGHDKLLAFSCKRRGFCPSCGARRMSQTATHLVELPANTKTLMNRTDTRLMPDLTIATPVITPQAAIPGPTAAISCMPTLNSECRNVDVMTDCL